MDILPVPIHDYKVLIRCYTFNHSRYIEDALNGFVRQQTNFPFVCLIVDDASTDGEQKVIKSFLDKECDMDSSEYYETDFVEIFIAHHRTNLQCTMVIYFLKENHYSINRTKRPYVDPWRDHCKYEAMCEGDDYWIDPQKLQKQVDFLESHPDYSMCFHRAQLKNEDNLYSSLHCDDIEDRTYSPDELFSKWIVPTASIVHKKEVWFVHNKGVERLLNGDILLVLNSAKLGKIWGMSDAMSVYRIQESGVTYSKPLEKKRTMAYPAHFEFIKENYPFLNQKIVNYKLSRAFMNRRKVQHSFLGYLSDIFKAIRYYPLIVFDKFLK